MGTYSHIDSTVLEGRSTWHPSLVLFVMHMLRADTGSFLTGDLVSLYFCPFRGDHVMSELLDPALRAELLRTPHFEGPARNGPGCSLSQQISLSLSCYCNKIPDRNKL